MKKKFLHLLFFLFLNLASFAQFHSSISNVVKSKSIPIGDFKILDNGNILGTSTDLWIGIIDTSSKAIIYDTSYYGNCPFGLNYMTHIEEHPMNGYIASGIINECGYSKAIILWMDSTTKEIKSYIAPNNGFQGTQATFQKVAVNPVSGFIYAVKTHFKPLQNDQKKRPSLLYSFDDSLNLIRIDTLTQSNPGNGIILDFDMASMSLVYSSSPRDSYKYTLNLFDLNSYNLRYTYRFPEYSVINSLSIDTDFIYLDRTIGKGIGIQNYLESTSSLEKYSLLTGQLIDSNNYSLGKEFSLPGGSFILSEKDHHYLVYWKYGFKYDTNGDSIYFHENELISFNDDLQITNKTSLTFGPSFSNDTNSSYHFTSVLAVDIDHTNLYYRINMTPRDSSSSIFYLNKVNLDFLLSQKEHTDIITDIKVYPNPASEALKILNFEKINPNSQYRIYSMDGRCLANGKISPIIAIGYLKSAMYILKVYAENNQEIYSQIFFHY